MILPGKIFQELPSVLVVEGGSDEPR